MSNKGLYARLPTTEHDWVNSFGYAKWLMQYQFDIPLTFEESEYIIKVNTGEGILSMLDGIYINIDPDTCLKETSQNFRQIALSCGISGIMTSDSPLGFFYLFCPPISNTRHMNKMVYKALCKKGQEHPEGRMRMFAEEALDLSSDERPPDDKVESNVKAYLAKYMPFLEQE
jgi:hypothetical protein